MKITDLFNKPRIMGLAANPDEGKSNLLYWMIRELKENYSFNLYSYGLRMDMEEQKIFSIEELESIEDGIIFIDEFASLLKLDNRKLWTSVEKTLRLIYHNNNIIVLSGLPEGYHKFISAKLDIFLYKKCNIADFINNSRMKNVAMQYSGNELGYSVLNIKKNEVLIFDGHHYDKIQIPYLESCDTKRTNKKILVKKEESNETNNAYTGTGI